MESCQGGIVAGGSWTASGAAWFAIGDVRSGSTKRVAAAVGEGAAVVAQLHGVLSARH